eukprot:scaffold88875_cov63-Phaeocystis_antarctica.AAC.1
MWVGSGWGACYVGFGSGSRVTSGLGLGSVPRAQSRESASGDDARQRQIPPCSRKPGAPRQAIS